MLLLPLLPALLALSPLAPQSVALQFDEVAVQGDPTVREVPLPCAEGWHASLVVDNGETGIWTVRSYQVFEQYGCPEIVGLDDLGRCHVLVGYSGKWTPKTVISEGKWLGALAHGDVDPRVEGSEVYTGGQLGNLYQVLPYRSGQLDQRLIASFPGLELHTVLAGELDPRNEGPELLVFTRPGGLFRVAPTGPHGTFVSEHIQDLPGRVRDAVVIPSGDGPEIATVSRAGRVELLRMTEDGPRWSTIHEAPMGKGRLTLAPPHSNRGTVLYTTQDDGCVLRHEHQGWDEWSTEKIYLGPQGPRGLAAGPFDADPDVETLAVFGYSGRVQVLSRQEDGSWHVDTIFEDRNKGHWLAVAEVDSRNATREIIGSGYGARIFLLSRPPGYGTGDVATDPDGDFEREAQLDAAALDGAAAEDAEEAGGQ